MKMMISDNLNKKTVFEKLSHYDYFVSPRMSCFGFANAYTYMLILSFLIFFGGGAGKVSPL